MKFKKIKKIPIALGEITEYYVLGLIQTGQQITKLDF
jgi:hypothetical protein